MSQPFMYIFAILVIGFILVFGFFQVKKVLDFGADVEEVSFRKDLQRAVDEVYTLAPGSKKVIDNLIVPSSVEGVCFVDATRPVRLSDIPFPLIREDLELLGSTRKNVFFVSRRGEDRLEAFIVTHLRPQGVVCFNLSLDRLNFVLENEGNVVGLRAYES